MPTRSDAAFRHLRRLMTKAAEQHRHPSRGLSLQTLEARCLLAADAVLYWNALALDAVANDHTPALVSTADQGGPTRTSRALAIVHVAMYDALNSIEGAHKPYLVAKGGSGRASKEAAVAQAAHDTLAALYPQQRALFDAALHAVLDEIPNGRAENEGVAVGRFVARKILLARQNDGFDAEVDHVLGTDPGDHRVDPLHPDQGLLTPHWGKVQPFAMTHGSQFRVPGPPELTSEEYAAAYNEVKRLGDVNSAERTDEQTEIGIFWGYDGTPGLGTPPRMLNQIARTIAIDQGNTMSQNARLLALVNVAMADAGIASWDSKYEYDFWRPIVAIRQEATVSDAGGMDGNLATAGDAGWTPLGAPASNQGGTNFTPPFPAYTSGHATFGAATFRSIAHFYGTDQLAFSFTSDEFNGVTTDQFGVVRPVVTRSYNSLSEASQENADSRIYLGIHWRFDATDGIVQGNAIADHVFARLFQPLVVNWSGHPARPPQGGSPGAGDPGGGRPSGPQSPEPRRVAHMAAYVRETPAPSAARGQVTRQTPLKAGHVDGVLADAQGLRDVLEPVLPQVRLG